ncbi:uncharacterized protein LOC107262686 isoform X2 [Ricinus communis]|uniref:uncharacterized protein LOC107262686 isoform X2 n=1 Tax=Ricinus communis TaxID=3988 RepID=UPI000772BDF1|nr:uncharacterized protein LOC107262686 isoform X2 [Ricinus communis]|eukprot:XP_015584436.1 uncharacterized protein LOC107262686 isoform X2 [Ricinus communis]
MAKKSQKRPVRHERDQSGCMWGLISMFDFRHGRSTQKLLSDRRRGTRHVAPGNALDKPDLLINRDESCRGTVGGEGSTNVAADTGKPSVKKLMDDEMLCEKDAKKETNSAGVEPKQPNSDYGSQKRKSRKRTNRSRTKSCEIYIEDLDAAENLQLEKPCRHRSEKQSTNSLDMDDMVEEFCRQIRRISCLKHDQHGELHDQPNQKNPDFEEKLKEAIELFIRHRLSKGKHGAVDEDIHPSKELKDAIKILSSDEELSMKLLQGPKSLMVKYIENLWNAQVEKDEVSKPLVGSNLSEQEIRDLKQTDEVVHSKQRKFFRRKAKSLEKTPSNKATQASNKIVILKPGPALLEKPETEGSIGPAPESQPFIRYKGPDERVGSYFFLSEIKRKLKQAMGKEQPEIAPDSISKKFPNKHWARADTDRRYKENAGRNSPGKEHFFIEKIARPSGVKKGEKTDKSKVCETGVERETGNNSKQRLTNIYVEAKKHLSEMVTSGNGEGDFSSRQVPRTLGRILSLPEYNCSPFGSPGRDWGQSFVTAQMRFSANDKFQKQENNVSHLGRMTLNSESELCASDENTNGKAEASIDSNSSASNDIVQDIEVERISCFIGDGTTSEGDVEIIKADEIVVQGDVNILDSLSEPSNSCITRDDQTGGLSEVSDAKGYSDSLRVDSDEEIQPLPSLLTTLSSSPVTKKENDQECSVEVSDRPSPVSVLEPLFTEEDISPASTRYQPAELPMPPLRIQFEEHGPSSTDLGTHLKACIQDKESVFEYIKAVLEASELNWDEFYIMSNSSDPLLDPSIYDEDIYEFVITWMYYIGGLILQECCMQVTSYVCCYVLIYK